MHRGISKEESFNQLGLDVRYNTLAQFKERLFFYGNKSKYFWNNEFLKSSFEFEINEVSDKMFEFIFNSFKIVYKSPKNSNTEKYIQKNKVAFEYFSNDEMEKHFLSNIKKLDDTDKIYFRNYYLTILHQLGDLNFANKSLFLSSTTDLVQAHRFSKKDNLIINFWIVNDNSREINKSTNLPLFAGKPYKQQKETSIFLCILPHYIYSFTYRNKEYFNPHLAIKNEYDYDIIIINGIDVNQKNFKNKLRNETNFKKGVSLNAGVYKIID
ncbi:MAG: hypothetical protein IPK18_09930 [Sphingobacteriales bacterium]|nr:MAG: hypothetical protein IPK18_09930 [Sphingobacteriales bacterium]